MRGWPGEQRAAQGHAWLVDPVGGNNLPDPRPLGRPVGELRSLVYERLQASPEPLAWLDLLGTVQAAPAVVRSTVNNLARAGLVQRAGRKACPGINRGLTLYAAAVAAPEPAGAPWALLQAAWRGSGDACGDDCDGGGAGYGHAQAELGAARGRPVATWAEFA